MDSDEQRKAIGVRTTQSVNIGTEMKVVVIIFAFVGLFLLFFGASFVSCSQSEPSVCAEPSYLVSPFVPIVFSGPVILHWNLTLNYVGLAILVVDSIFLILGRRGIL